MGTYDLLLFFILPYDPNMMTISFATDADRTTWLASAVIPNGMQVDIVKRNPDGTLV